MPLQRAEEFVEFVGGVEVGFELAGGEALAKIVEAAGEEIERGRKDVAVGEDNVAPRGIRAARETQRIAQAGTRKRDGQAVLIEAVVEKRRKRDGGELREMRNEADGVVVLLRAEPERLCADFLKDFEKGGDTGVVGGGGFLRGGRSTGLKTRHYSGIGRFADQGIGGIAEK